MKTSKNAWIVQKDVWSKRTSLVNWQLSKEAWANSGKQARKRKNDEKCELPTLWQYDWVQLRSEQTEDQDRIVTCVKSVKAKKDKVLTLKVSFKVKRQVYIDKSQKPVHRSKKVYELN